MKQNKIKIVYTLVQKFTNNNKIKAFFICTVKFSIYRVTYNERLNCVFVINWFKSWYYLKIKIEIESIPTFEVLICCEMNLKRILHESDSVSWLVLKFCKMIFNVFNFNMNQFQYIKFWSNKVKICGKNKNEKSGGA